MKLKTFLLLGFLTFQSFSQVSVGPSHIGTSKKFSKGVLEKFKNTETVFLLSSVYDKEVYEQILRDSWDVTPFRVENLETFNIEEFLSDKYSFARLGGFEKIYSGTEGRLASLFTYVDFQIFDNEKILKKINKLSEKKKGKKISDLIENNSSNIARFYIYPKDEFIHKAIPYKKNDTELSLYTDDVFFNYKPGLLKNYFQKVNNLIKAEEEYWLYKNDYLPELKNLAGSKLYVPSYITLKYNSWTGKDKEGDDMEDILKRYNFDFEIVQDDDLSERIMNKEDFYYLRYVRMNSERFLQVVNSRSGEIVYRDYITGFAYNLKFKQIEDLNKSIDKALGK